MVLLLCIGAVVLFGIGLFGWVQRSRAALPAWTDFQEQRIGSGMSQIEGRVDGHPLRASASREDEHWRCKIWLDLSALLEARWRFGANLDTGRVWTWFEGRQLLILASVKPAAARDDQLAILNGACELEMRLSDDRRAVGARALEVIELMRRVAGAVRAEALREAFFQADTSTAREKVLLLLLALHPEHAVTLEMLDLCAESDEPVLELIAAKRMTGTRRETVLFWLVEGEHSHDGVRAEALELLRPSLDRESAHRIALALLEGSPSLSRRGAIRLLAQFPPEEAPVRLLDIAQHVQDPGTAGDLVETLAAIGGERSLRGLEHLLGAHGVQQRTLEVLSRLGDRRTLGAIHEQLEILTQANLRLVVDETVRAIRDRLGAPDGGRLSVVEAAGTGELSVSDGGRIGLAEE